MKSTSTTCRSRERGIAAITALFLIVAIAALGTAIVRVSTISHVGQSNDFGGARAYQAARFGVEWSVYQLLKGACSGGDFCALCRSAPYATPTTQNLSGLAGDLASFSVSISCASGAGTYSEGLASVRVYKITANACSVPNAGSCPNTTAAAVSSLGYLERQVSLTLSD